MQTKKKKKSLEGMDIFQNCTFCTRWPIVSAPLAECRVEKVEWNTNKYTMTILGMIQMLNIDYIFNWWKLNRSKVALHCTLNNIYAIYCFAYFDQESPKWCSSPL